MVLSYCLYIINGFCPYKPIRKLITGHPHYCQSNPTTKPLHRKGRIQWSLSFSILNVQIFFDSMNAWKSMITCSVFFVKKDQIIFWVRRSSYKMCADSLCHRGDVYSKHTHGLPWGILFRLNSRLVNFMDIFPQSSENCVISVRW